MCGCVQMPRVPESGTIRFMVPTVVMSAPEHGSNFKTPTERRRSVRVPAAGLVHAGIALRTEPDIRQVTVRDIGLFGMSLLSARPIAAALGERVFGVVTFYGTPRHAPIRGALFRLTVRRRQPDTEGYLLGVEFADLRASPWEGLVAWIERGHEPEPPQVHPYDWPLTWP